MKQRNKNFNDIAVLINKKYPLPPEYVPPDLTIPNIPFSDNEYSEKKLLRLEASLTLEDLFHNAAEHNIYLFGVSGYRSYQRQAAIFEHNLQVKGKEHTEKYSAFPGKSEHQTGLAIDVSCLSIHNHLDEVFSITPEGKWLENNCCHFGFILRYPKLKTDITGYAFEPWHIRYVGKELAYFLFENSITLEEYYN